MRIGSGFTMTEVSMDIVNFSERRLQSLLHQRKSNNIENKLRQTQTNVSVLFIGRM